LEVKWFVFECRPVLLYKLNVRIAKFGGGGQKLTLSDPRGFEHEVIRNRFRFEISIFVLVGRPESGWRLGSLYLNVG
jgi:hypothetical protein